MYTQFEISMLKKHSITSDLKHKYLEMVILYSVIQLIEDTKHDVKPFQNHCDCYYLFNPQREFIYCLRCKYVFVRLNTQCRLCKTGFRR